MATHTLVQHEGQEVMEEATAPETFDGIAIKTENAEYRVYATLTTDKETGEQKISKREVVNTPDFEAWQGKNPNAQVELTQTVRKYKVGSYAGLVQLIGDEEEAINIINKGLSAKFSQKINKALLDTNEDGSLSFEPVEGVYDSRDLLQEATQRKSLSPIEKVTRVAKAAGFSPEEVAAFLAQLQQARMQG